MSITKQPTITSFVSVSLGYETDDVPTTQPRRSSRVVTPARQVPGIIVPSSYSRRGLVDLGLGRDVQDEHIHRRRERSASLPRGLEMGEPGHALVLLFQSKGTSNQIRECSASVSEVEIANLVNPPHQLRAQKSQPLVEHVNQSGPPIVDLAQDLDEENEQIQKQKRNQPDDHKYDSPYNHFGKPEHGVNKDGVPDPPDGPGYSYTCCYCGKVVRISGSSRSNLKVHCDGSNAPGKSGSGCPRCQQAIAAGAKLPPTVSKLNIQRCQQDHQRGLEAFITPAPTFSN